MTLSPGKQLKHAVLCALAEQIYHHSGGDVMRDGISTWFGRKRSSLFASRRSSKSSRDPGKSASAAAELQPAMLQPATSTETSTESPRSIRSTSPRGTKARTSPKRARIRASLSGMWGGAHPGFSTFHYFDILVPM